MDATASRNVKTDFILVQGVSMKGELTGLVWGRNSYAVRAFGVTWLPKQAYLKILKSAPTKLTLYKIYSCVKKSEKTYVYIALLKFKSSRNAQKYILFSVGDVKTKHFPEKCNLSLGSRQNKSHKKASKSHTMVQTYHTAVYKRYSYDTFYSQL